MAGFSKFFCDAEFATAGMELLFTIGRKFPYGTSTVSYEIVAETAVLDTDFDDSVDALFGVLTFVDAETCKVIRINTMGGGASGNRTVRMHLSKPGADVIEAANCIGTIQDGDIYYVDEASSGAGTVNDDTDPYGVDQLYNLLNVTEAGRAVLLKRGDTFTYSAQISLEANRGGTIENPIIFGAYGSGAKPRYRPPNSYSRAMWFRAHHVPDQNRSYIVQDILFIPPMLGGNGYTSITIGENDDSLPENITLQHVDFANPDATEKYGQNISFNTCDNCTVKFCNIQDGDGVGIISAPSSQGLDLICNYVANNGSDPTYNWGIYLSSSYCNFIGNYLTNNEQCFKYRGGHDINIYENHFDCKEGSSLGVSFGGDSPQESTGAPVKELYNFNLCRNVVFGQINFKEQGVSDNSTDLADVVTSYNLKINDNYVYANFSHSYPGPISFVQSWQIGSAEVYGNTLINDISNGRILLVGSAGRPFAADPAVIKFKNNVCYRLNNDSTIPFIYTVKDDDALGLDSDYNYFEDLTSGQDFVLINATGYATLADWRTETGNDLNSITGTLTLNNDSELGYPIIPIAGADPTRRHLPR